MARITSSEFRRALASCLDRVCMSREPLTVTRRGGHPVVVMPLDEYEGLMETIHLLKSPANADRLLRSIAHADAGELLFSMIQPQPKTNNGDDRETARLRGAVDDARRSVREQGTVPHEQVRAWLLDVVQGRIPQPVIPSP